VADNIEEPQLRTTRIEPRGVLQGNLKPLIYVGAALLVIAAAVLSAFSSNKPHAKVGPPQPLLMDNTDSNAQIVKGMVPVQSVDQQAPKQAPDPDYAPGGKFFGCVPGQPCTPQMRQDNPQQAQQLTPQQQVEQQMATKEKELEFEGRFASSIAYARTGNQPARGSALQGPVDPNQDGGNAPSSLIKAHAPGEAPEEKEEKRATEVNLDSATGPLYVLREGVTMDTILENRLDGDAVGPVKVMVSNPVYSHDNQNVLIPEGTVVLGEARKIGAASFGAQRRMAIVFHRMLMPDGYTVDLDQFKGLDQTGSMGAKDLVNNHYLQIFGASIALGVVAGTAMIEQGGGAFSGSGSQTFTYGASSSISQSATTILDRFIQIPPTITIREGHRIKIWFTQDVVLPAYQNHTIPPSF
jgi:type IV secretory pathway VirB10-like protein